MRLLLLFLSVFVLSTKLGAQCPGYGYASSTELVDNGDFSQGNTDFSSAYTYCNTGYCINFQQGKYTVDKDASAYGYYYYGKDHTTGKGDFFIGTTDATSGSTAWCQTVRVKPRTNYNISAWFSNINAYSFGGAASLQFSISGTPIGSSFSVPSDTNKWQKQEVLWYSGNNSSVNVCIINKSSAAFYGLGFGIDDISMRECLCYNPAKAFKDTTICQGDSAALSASYGTKYVWAPNPTLSCLTCEKTVARPTTSTTYSVSVTDTSSCISSALVRVTVNSVPKPKIKGDSAICNGSFTQLKTTIPNAQYYWSTGGTDSFININKPGKYWVNVTVKGCSGSDTFTVKENNTIFSLGKDTALCDGSTLTLDITKPADSLVWHDGSHNRSFTVTTAGKYWATLITGNCSFTDTIEVTYKPNPVVELGNDITLCEGEKITLDAGNAGASYKWSTGNTSQTITVDKTGKYGVQVTSNGCTSSDSINIAFQPPFTVNLGKDTVLCQGSAIKLSPQNAAWVNPGFLWNDGQTTQDYDITKPGKYWVTVKSGACSASDTILIQYKPRPVVNLENDITVCADEPVILGQSILADKYIWNTGETTQTITAGKPGTYWVNAEINGCMASDTIEVNFLTLPVFDLGKDTTLCEGQTLLLHANIPNVKYLWQDGFISPYHTVTKAGTYWAKVDNGTCDYTDTIHVKYNAYPKIELGEDTLLCPGEKLVLNAFVDGATYFWSDSTTAGIKEISAPGKYWVEVAQGPCKYADTITVYYNDSPQVNLGKDTTFCGVEMWRLDAGNLNSEDAEYEWNTGQKSSSIIVSEPGTYWAKVSFCGVSVTDTISLGFINYKPDDLLMPNAFSPNDDKLNDTLRAVGMDMVDAFEWRIYNRWGQLVYKTDDITKAWDGKFNGLPSPEGLYHWKLSLRSSCLKDDELSKSGIVYLIR